MSCVGIGIGVGIVMGRMVLVGGWFGGFRVEDGWMDGFDSEMGSVGLWIGLNGRQGGRKTGGEREKRCRGRRWGGCFYKGVRCDSTLDAVWEKECGQWIETLGAVFIVSHHCEMLCLLFFRTKIVSLMLISL